MTDLSKICGLPIQIDEDTQSIYYDESVKFDKELNVPISEIVPVLLNKFIKYPENVYKQYRKILNTGADNSQNLSYDLMVIPFGLLGIEYIKTHIYYSKPVKDKFACFLEMVRGEVTVIIQKNKENEDPYAYTTAVENVDILVLKEGERLAIPTGVYYTFVNTGTNQTIFTVVYANMHQKIDYSTLQKEKGLAFYIISKNARLEIVANPKYKTECEACKHSMNELDEEERTMYIHSLLNEKAPLYDMLRNYSGKLMTALALQ